MNDDPMNLRPLDADWYRRFNEAADVAAKQLGAFVVIIAAQEGGKMGTGVAEPDTMGPELKQIAELAGTDFVAFLGACARAVYMQDQLAKRATKQ